LLLGRFQAVHESGVLSRKSLGGGYQLLLQHT
jgi:hypothetical protein